MVGFPVSRKKERTTEASSTEQENVVAGLPSLRCGNIRSMRAASILQFYHRNEPVSAGARRAFAGGDISQNELGVDYIDVADWIDRSAYMVDIIVDKASDYLNNCIHLADVAEKLVAEALALARTANQSAYQQTRSRPERPFATSKGRLIDLSEGRERSRPLDLAR